MTTFGDRYPRGPEFLARLEQIETTAAARTPISKRSPSSSSCSARR